MSDQRRHNQYLKITLEDLKSFKKFDIKKTEQSFKILMKRARKPIFPPIPITLNEKIAKLVGMMPDGSLEKNLRSISFGQKKDPSKVNEFKKFLISELGVPEDYIRIKRKKDTKFINVGNRTLTTLFYRFLDVSKSDEEEKIPSWIWNSPKFVIKTYIREIFAMEGTVEDPSIGRKEVRFHTCDQNFAFGVKKLLEKIFEIDSSVRKYHILEYGFKYYVEILGRENLEKFSKIGISLKTHQKRLNDLIKSYKPKAWQITLITILGLPKKKFKNFDLRKKFNLHRRTIHWRLGQLIKKGYIRHLDKKTYTLTKKGKIIAKKLLNKGIEVVSLRTNPKINEKRIIRCLKEKHKYINQIARELKINRNTVRDVVNRLVRKQKVKLIKKDKFQRKYYGLK